MLSATLNIIASVLAALIVVIVYESSKYYISLTLLHPIHRRREDVKINPLKFVDPIGIILFVFAHVGWQKPKEYNASRFKDKDRALVVLSTTGILTCLILMLAVTPLYVTLFNGFNGSLVSFFVARFCLFLIRFSFAIIIVNLLPIPPFDMTRIIYAINPSFYFKMIQNQRILQAVFVLLIAIPIRGVGLHRSVLSAFIDSMFDPLIKLFI